MNQSVSRHAIRKKTIQTGSITLLSRGCGLIREIIFIRYLGAADIFWAAFRIPNFLRKIFAEGALSAAFIPTMVQTMHSQGKEEAARVMMLTLILFQGALAVLSLLFGLYAEQLLLFLTPGFSPDQIHSTAQMLIMLSPFIFFISACALFAGALQAVNHFFIPAIAPIAFNLVLIIGMLLGMAYHIDSSSVCYWIIVAGFIQCLMHVAMYYHLKLTFALPTKDTLSKVMGILGKFITCIPGTAMTEVSLVVDTIFASYIPGALSGIQYANRFMGIPLGVFATTFATILLPHFSRLVDKGNKRISFYIHESVKLILWITAPITLGMAFFSHDIFHTLFVSEKFSVAQATMTGNILIATVFGLFFFSLNKILLNVFYAQHNTLIPSIIAVLSMGLNVLLNIALVRIMAAPGLALGTTIAAATQMIITLWCLSRYSGVVIYGRALGRFIVRYAMQLLIVGTTFLSAYYLMVMAISHGLSGTFQSFFLRNVGFWLWVGPLSVAAFFMLWITRNQCGVTLYFLDE